MQSVVTLIAHYNCYSSVDVKIAYHQVPLVPEERKHTASEANGRDCQFMRLLLGLDNAVY